MSTLFTIPTSCEQLHHGKSELHPASEVRERLFIDLDVCFTGGCAECSVRCSFFFHPDNLGIRSVAELASYYLVCRRCEDPHCVAVCPTKALEQQPDRERMLVRHNLRCVGCRSCSHACPYGTIYPELVPHIVDNCDFCLGRRGRGPEPLCVHTCAKGALALRPMVAPEEADTFLVGGYLAVHSTHWRRD